MTPILQLLTCLCLLQWLPATNVAAHPPKQPDSLSNNYLFAEWKHLDSTLVLGRFTQNGKKRQAQFTTKTHTEISFIWHAGGILYRKNWDGAAGKGEPLGQMVQWVHEHYQGNIHALCHSMGNRFFQGILRKLPSAKMGFKSITLFSADLAQSSADNDFITCQNATPALYIYMHQKDRFLLLSAWIHGIKRLGRCGPEPNIPAVTVIDMTEHTRGLQNHTHTDKAWVQMQLAAQLLR